MAAAPVQSASSQANPGGSFINPQGICLTSATGAGNLIIAAVALAFDVASETFTCTDTLGQTYTQIDILHKSGDYNFATFKCENSAVLPAPIAITFTGSLSSGATTFTMTSTWALPTATYIVRFSSGEVRPVTLTNGSATATTWGDGLGQSATSSATAGYGPFFQCTADGDFGIAAMIEISGVPTSSTIVAHNALINSGITNGANKVNCGSLACGAGTGLLLMLVDCVANGAGSPTFTPIVGTTPVAFTKFGSSFWDYGSGNPNAIWQYAHLSAPGTITPTAGTTETASDDYYVYGMFIADAPSDTLMGQACL